MSMCSSFVYGYGFHIDKCDEKVLIDFIKTHENTFCRSDEEKYLFDGLDKTGSSLDKLFENYSCDSTGVAGVGAVIANIMSRETGICFIYCQSDDSCDTPASIVFETSYPWLLNKIEKELTEDELQNICRKYMNELELTNEQPCHLALEYYG